MIRYTKEQAPIPSLSDLISVGIKVVVCKPSKAKRFSIFGQKAKNSMGYTEGGGSQGYAQRSY